MSAQAFQNLGGNTILFGDGNYVMTQGGYHSFWTAHGGTSNNPPAATPGMTQFDAIQDQYMVELGVSHPAPRIPGLGLTLSVRDEGVPAHNLIGNNLGFRRPGFGISLTPGFIYTRGSHMLQFSLGKVMIRDRTKSVAEEVNGVHEGDAAFANYVWMASYTLRVPGRKRGVEANAAVPNGTARRASRAPDIPAGFPAFSLRDLEGRKRTLKDFANKLTLVTFFFPSCQFCNVELPEIQKIYDRYGKAGLSAVWINILPEEERLIPGWKMAKKLTVPVLLGGAQAALQRDYRIESTPATYLLDENGRVLFHQDGYTPGDEKTLETKIAALLDASPSSADRVAGATVCK
jgi:cytochrome oxidase Cu insertion factor (SCO1/SenC/PrrC family)